MCADPQSLRRNPAPADLPRLPAVLIRVPAARFSGGLGFRGAIVPAASRFHLIKFSAECLILTDRVRPLRLLRHHRLAVHHRRRTAVVAAPPGDAMTIASTRDVKHVLNRFERSNMNLPRMTAEASLYRSTTAYCGTVGSAFGPITLALNKIPPLHLSCPPPCTCSCPTLAPFNLCLPPCTCTCPPPPPNPCAGLRLGSRVWCMCECVNSMGPFAPPNNICSGPDDPCCADNCQVKCFGTGQPCVPL